MTVEVRRPPDSAIKITRLTYADLRNNRDVPEWTLLTSSQADVLRAHPHARGEDVVVIGAMREAQSLGRLIMIPGSASVNGRTFPVSWSSGWEASADTPGVGSLLLLGAVRAAGSFGACLMSSDALRVVRAARWPLVRMPRFVLLRRSVSYWRQSVPAPLARVLAPPTDLALAAYRAGATIRRYRGRRFVVDEVPAFDESVDGVDSARAERLYFRRDHRELNWAMTTTWDPEARANLHGFVVRERASTETLGYALARTRSYGTARVSSVFRTAVRAGRRDALRALLTSVVARLEADDPDLIDVAGTDAALVDLARGHGMLRHGGIDLGCQFGPALKAEHPRLEDFRLDMAEGDVLLL